MCGCACACVCSHPPCPPSEEMCSHWEIPEGRETLLVPGLRLHTIIATANLIWCMAYTRGSGAGRILRISRAIALQ